MFTLRLSADIRPDNRHTHTHNEWPWPWSPLTLGGQINLHAWRNKMHTHTLQRGMFSGSAADKREIRVGCVWGQTGVFFYLQHYTTFLLLHSGQKICYTLPSAKYQSRPTLATCLIKTYWKQHTRTMVDSLISGCPVLELWIDVRPKPPTHSIAMTYKRDSTINSRYPQSL